MFRAHKKKLTVEIRASLAEGMANAVKDARRLRDEKVQRRDYSEGDSVEDQKRMDNLEVGAPAVE